MRLRMIYPDAGEEVLEIAQDSFVVGRAPDCDVVVNKPYVSKRHAKILRGVVVADLGSANGTLVGGQPIREPVVVQGQQVVLGRDGIVLVLESDGEPDFAMDPLGATIPIGDVAGIGDAETGRLPGDDELRQRKLELEAEVQRLTGELALATASPSAESEELNDLRRENEDLRHRLASSKDELQVQVAEDGESVQAVLAREQLSEAMERNAELERKLAEAEARAGGAAPAAPEPAAPPAFAELFAQLQQKNRDLQEEVERLKSSGGEVPSAAGASELFFKLQAENTELKRRLSEAESQSPTPGGGATSDAAIRLQREKMELESRLRGMDAERQRLEGELAAARATAGGAPPVPKRAAPTGGVAKIIAKLVEEDIDGQVAPADASGEGFIVFEQVRFLRQVERVVTRIAGEFIQLYQLKTMLPDREGDYRGLAADVLASDPGDSVRDELAAYLSDLGKWLVAALGAHRKAASRFAEQLKHDLSERSLTSDAKVSGIKKLREAELWKRANEYLDALTPDFVDERIEKLAREAAQEIVEGH